jgi:hypothetical protein
MNPSHLNANIVTQAAISALKYAYEECNDLAAKESIYSAARAIIQLNRDLEKYSRLDKNSENNYDYDPSEFCAAV